MKADFSETSGLNPDDTHRSHDQTRASHIVGIPLW
jgi:hypothetical protein